MWDIGLKEGDIVLKVTAFGQSLQCIQSLREIGQTLNTVRVEETHRKGPALINNHKKRLGNFLTKCFKFVKTLCFIHGHMLSLQMI